MDIYYRYWNLKYDKRKSPARRKREQARNNENHAPHATKNNEYKAATLLNPILV